MGDSSFRLRRLDSLKFHRILAYVGCIAQMVPCKVPCCCQSIQRKNIGLRPPRRCSREYHRTWPKLQCNVDRLGKRKRCYCIWMATRSRVRRRFGGTVDRRRIANVSECKSTSRGIDIRISSKRFCKIVTIHRNWLDKSICHRIKFSLGDTTRFRLHLGMKMMFGIPRITVRRFHPGIE